MLRLNGFELYSLWVPLKIPVPSEDPSDRKKTNLKACKVISIFDQTSLILRLRYFWPLIYQVNPTVSSHYAL